MCGIIKSIQSEKQKSTFLLINNGIECWTVATAIGHLQLAE